MRPSQFQRVRQAVTAVALSLVLVACGGEAPETSDDPATDQSSGDRQATVSPDQPTPVAIDALYQCQDMRVRLQVDGQLMQLDLLGRQHQLQRERSASGARYIGGDVEFWDKGSQAILGLGPQRFSCQRLDPSDLESSKADQPLIYRAQGNEPGWHVEIRQGMGLRASLVLDSGARVVELEGVRTETVHEGVHIYRAGSGRDAMRLRITDAACQDTMSGSEFATRAELQFGDGLYFGCGTAIATLGGDSTQTTTPAPGESPD